jgi:ribosomal protein S9
MLNIAGTQWLKKNYVVKVALIHDGKYFYGEGKRKTTLFAMFLDVEGGEVPLNRKAFSKALQTALENAVKEMSKS